MRLHIRTDEREEPPVEIAPGETVLIGRQSSSDELDAALRAGRTIRAVTAPSPSVSGNHVLVTHTADKVEVVDLESRNGTWLELAAHVPVTIPATASVRLRLAPVRQASTDLDLPADAEWTHELEFVPSVLLAVQTWLQRRGVAARARVEKKRATAATEDALGRVALDDECDLVVEAVHTMDARWLSTLRRVTQYVERQHERYRAERELGAAGLVVASKGMKRAVHQVIEAAARPGRALLLLGPSGVGKEGLARCYHARTRPRGPFVSRNCAQFQFGKDLVLSELFGAEKGSYTGATRTTIGAVELAHQGTLLLDELGELPLDVQSVLLRFLDRGEFNKAGSSTTQTADARLVGATNKDLRAACLEGSFRRDLWFRLAAEVVEVPPLSERFEDISAYLATRTRGDHSLLEAFDPDALEVLRTHGWEGNFRELINFANRLPEVDRISAELCRQTLYAGALLVPPPVAAAVAAPPAPDRPRPAAAEGDLSRLFDRATDAWREDRGSPPRQWRDVKELVEEYVKPLLFAELSGVADATPETLDLRAAADKLAADRGTAQKQLERYFARFVR